MDIVRYQEFDKVFRIHDLISPRGIVINFRVCLRQCTSEVHALPICDTIPSFIGGMRSNPIVVGYLYSEPNAVATTNPIKKGRDSSMSNKNDILMIGAG